MSDNEQRIVKVMWCYPDYEIQLENSANCLSARGEGVGSLGFCRCPSSLCKMMLLILILIFSFGNITLLGEWGLRKTVVKGEEYEKINKFFKLDFLFRSRDGLKKKKFLDNFIIKGRLKLELSLFIYCRRSCLKRAQRVGGVCTVYK